MIVQDKKNTHVRKNLFLCSNKWLDYDKTNFSSLLARGSLS